MAREKVISGTRPWRCPICDAQRPHGTNWRTARGLAQHIAMMNGASSIKEEGAHKEWRRKHGISPFEYETMKEVPKMIEQIRQIINADPSLFRIGGEDWLWIE